MPKSNDPRIYSAQCDNLHPVQIMHENPWFKVLNRGGYFSVEYHCLDIVVLPIVENKHIVMVRVERPIIADAPLELPAGAVDKDETLIQAAARELKEETGISINQLNRFMPLSPVCVIPNRTPLLTSVFTVAISMQEYRMRKEHDDEIKEVLLLNYNELISLILRGDIYITMPLSVISRYLFEQLNHNNFEI